jgi:hypothetical protein
MSCGTPMGQAALLPGAGEVGNLSGQQTETGGGD